jgi:uncharacterized membrane protein
VSETSQTPAGAAKAQNIVIVVFNDENAAGEALQALLVAEKSQAVKLDASAVVRREDDGTVNIKETGEVGAGVGAAAGGALGLLLGAIAGRQGAALGAGLGALLGGAAAKYIDVGIPDARLKQLGESLQPGASAVAALVGDASLAQVKGLLATRGGTLVSEPISVDLAAQFGGGSLGATLAGAATTVESSLSQAADSTQQMVNQAMSSDAGKQAQDMVSQATESAQQMFDQAMSSDLAQQAKSAADSVIKQAGDAAQNLTGGEEAKPSA